MMQARRKPTRAHDQVTVTRTHWQELRRKADAYDEFQVLARRVVERNECLTLREAGEPVLALVPPSAARVFRKLLEHPDLYDRLEEEARGEDKARRGRAS